MELKIYSQDGTLKMTVSPSDSSTHVHELMGENVVNASFTSPEYVSLDVNDYLELEGKTYKLHTAYEPRQKSMQEYAYDVKFYGRESDVKRALMLYLTDGELEPKFSYEGSPRDHVQKVVDSLNYMEGGNRWVTGTVIDAPNLSLDYNNVFCDQALTELAGKLETEWWIEGYTVNLCRCEFGEAVELGYLHGLTNLQRSDNNTDVRFFTRLIPLGSTKNIDKGLYGFKRLQLPGREKYVDKDVDRYGIYPQVEESAFEGIFPHRTGTLSEVRSEERTGENGKYVVWYFKDSGLNFDPNEYDLSGLVKHAVFKSGDLQERDFEINFDSEKKEFEIITQYPDEESQLPGGNLIPASGDTYILYNLRMPDEYYAPAEAEYKAAVDAFLAKYSTDTSIYRGDTDYVHILEHGITLSVGRRVRLLSDNYFKETGHRDSRITKVTRKLNNLSQATIECTNAVGKGRMEVIESDVDSIKKMLYSQTDDLILSILRSWDSGDITDYKVFSALRTVKEILNRAISRVNDDTAAGIITFLKGLLIGGKGHGISVSDSGAVTAVFDELKNVFSIVSPDFVSGDLGNGYVLKYDQKTGRSYLEVDDLLVRKVAYFIELIIKQLRHVGGEIILTPASMECTKVEELADVYRCYFKQNDGERSIRQEFVAGDQACRRTFNVQEGTSHNVSNVYYWRLVTAVGDDYIDLSKADCDIGSMEPSAGDEIVQIGNRTDTTRQNAIILSTVGDDAPSIKQYKGINGYTLRNKEVTILSPTLNKFLGQFISEVTGKSYDDMFSDLKADFDIVKDQVDREFTIWFFEYAPTLSNIPAVEWTTDALKALHEQDIFYNRASGLAYRFEKNANGAYSWNSITDQQTVKALEDAAKAQDTADGKRRVFVSQPTNEKAYDIGDLWVNATYSGSGVNYSNDTLRCVTAKAVGAAFSISHWTPASNATTAYIKNLGDSILLTVGANDTEAKRLISVAQKAADAAGVTADAAKATGETNATAIKQNRDSISVVAGRFNSDGTLKNTSGLVTGNGTFATLFANAVVDGKIVKQADISTFITADQAGNLISNASIRADKVVFEGTSVKIASKYLDITGAVTFNSFNADLQGTINGKATTGYVDTAKTDAINSAASTAQSKVDALSNTLGSLAYKSAVEKAMLGTTLINGGYIRTDLIDAQTIVANALAADRITANYLTVTGESMIGGFKISGTSLASGPMTISTQNIQFSGDGITAGLGINTAPAALGLNVPLWINNNSSADKCIAARFSATGASEKENNIALALTGCISGFAVKLRSIASGGYLTLEDCFVSCSFTGSDQNVYLPKDPPVGKVYLIKRWPGTGRGPIVHANGSTLNGGATSDLLKEDNHLAICVWGGKSWSYNKISL